MSVSLTSHPSPPLHTSSHRYYYLCSFSFPPLSASLSWRDAVCCERHPPDQSLLPGLWQGRGRKNEVAEKCSVLYSGCFCTVLLPSTPRPAKRSNGEADERTKRGCLYAPVPASRCACQTPRETLQDAMVVVVEHGSRISRRPPQPHRMEATAPLKPEFPTGKTARAAGGTQPQAAQIPRVSHNRTLLPNRGSPEVSSRHAPPPLPPPPPPARTMRSGEEPCAVEATSTAPANIYMYSHFKSNDKGMWG